MKINNNRRELRKHEDYLTMCIHNPGNQVSLIIKYCISRVCLGIAEQVGILGYKGIIKMQGLFSKIG